MPEGNRNRYGGDPCTLHSVRNAFVSRRVNSTTRAKRLEQRARRRSRALVSAPPFRLRPQRCCQCQTSPRPRRFAPSALSRLVPSVSAGVLRRVCGVSRTRAISSRTAVTRLLRCRMVAMVEERFEESVALRGGIAMGFPVCCPRTTAGLGSQQLHVLRAVFGVCDGLPQVGDGLTALQRAGLDNVVNKLDLLVRQVFADGVVAVGALTFSDTRSTPGFLLQAGRGLPPAPGHVARASWP